MSFKNLIMLMYMNLLLCTTAGIIDGDLFTIWMGSGLLVLNMILHAFYEWKIKEMIGE